jgi:hypothetical protein
MLRSAECRIDRDRPLLTAKIRAIARDDCVKIWFYSPAILDYLKTVIETSHNHHANQNDRNSR